MNNCIPGERYLNVKVTPKASANRVKLEQLEDGTQRYLVYVTAVPEDGKANKEVIKLLTKELGIAKSSLTIMHGQTARNKVFKVQL